MLKGRDRSGDFSHLDEATSNATREILRATKPDFAAIVK